MLHKLKNSIIGWFKDEVNQLIIFIIIGMTLISFI